MQCHVTKCAANRTWCLYGKKKWLEELPPYQGGGGMIGEVKKDSISYGELPNKYEAGTIATAQLLPLMNQLSLWKTLV